MNAAIAATIITAGVILLVVSFASTFYYSVVGKNRVALVCSLPMVAAVWLAVYGAVSTQ